MRTDDFSSLRNGPSNISVEKIELIDATEPGTAQFAGRATALEDRLDTRLKTSSGSKAVLSKKLSKDSGSQGVYANKYIWNTIGRKASKITNSSGKLTTVSTN